MRRSSIVYKNVSAEHGATQLPPVTYHAKAAIIIGGLVAALVITTLLLMRISTIVALKIGGAAGVIVGSLFGVRWTWRVTTYDWVIDQEERQSKRLSETVMPSAPEGTGDASPIKNGRLDGQARMIIEREFLDELPTTRSECVNVGICNQPEWNLINTIMQEIGLRTSRSWCVDNYDDALKLWRSGVRITQDAIWVQADDKSWKKL